MNGEMSLNLSLIIIIGEQEQNPLIITDIKLRDMHLKFS